MSKRPILVVEDNPITRKMVRIALESEGYEVLEAADGRSALELAKERSPALVLQDFVLPDMDGLALLSGLRELPGGADLPVLLVTGMVSQLEDLRARTGGHTSVLAKPLEPSRLVEIVRGYTSGAGSKPGQGRRILLVDDELPGRKLATLRLRDAGFEVEAAGSGEEALRLAADTVPDAVLSDVLMPGMDGFELCRSIRGDARLGAVPVVLLSSAFVEEPDQHLARQMGANALLPRTPDLQHAVDALLRALQEGVARPAAPPAEGLAALHAKRLQVQLEKQVARNEALLRQGAIQAAALSVVRGLSMALANPREIPSVLADVLVHCLDSAGLSTGLLYLAGRDGQLRLQAQAGLPTAARASAAQCFGHPELLASVLEKGEPVAHVFQHEHDAALRDLGSILGRGSCLLVPFLVGEERVGLLVLAGSSQDFSEPVWTGFGRALSVQFGQTIALGRFLTRGAASEARYRSLMEQANDAILLLDASGIVEANQQAEALLGRPRADIVGRSYEEFVAPEQRDDANRRRADLAAGGGPSRADEHLVRPDGSRVPVEVSGSIARIGEESLRLLIVRDVTDRQRAQDELRRTEDLLQRSQRVEAIGRLAGGVAHDFNNILGVIIGSGELAQRQLPQEHPTRARVDQIVAAAQRAAELTRQLLAISRRQVQHTRIISLNDCIAEAEKMLGRLIGEDVTLVVHPAPDLGTAKADPSQVGQIILNLVVNARDAMPGGGRLTIETANVELDAAYAAGHAPAVPGRYVMLAVSDTGVGMDAETKAQIFEPFFTTKEEGKGTGLGLATVYGIVKQSGGYIWVYSEPEHGTTFKVYFPRVDEPAEPLHPAPPAADAPRGRETILLVEDAEALREVIRESLEERGYTVLLAADGQQALAHAREHTGPIDLLLTDVVMPGLGGGELARLLTELRPAIRVLHMSGYTNGVISQHGVLAKGVLLLEKPFTSERLARAVRDVLDRPPAEGSGTPTGPGT